MIYYIKDAKVKKTFDPNMDRKWQSQKAWVLCLQETADF